MKKHLFMTTVLAGAGILAMSAQPALAQSKAQPMKLSVGGSLMAAVAFSEQSGSFESSSNATSRVGYDSFNQWNDTELHFTGSVTLDNGITTSVHIELESDQVSNGTHIGESFLQMSGGFGTVKLGSTVNASGAMGHIAPAAGAIVPNDGDSTFVIVQPTAVTATADTLLGSNDTMRVVYISPSISGLSIGASYQPSSANVDTPPAVGGNSGTDTQEYNVAVAYSGKLGSVDLAADIGYMEAHGTAANSRNGWRGGLNLGFGAVTVGGSYRVFDAIDSGLAGTANSPEQESFDLGIAYAQGPFTVSATYLHGEAPLASATTGDDSVQMIFLGGAYSLGPGIDLLGNLMFVDWEDESTADANNNDGWGLTAGIACPSDDHCLPGCGSARVPVGVMPTFYRQTTSA